MKKLGAKSCHLVALSFAGVDARAAISMFEGHQHIESLTTVCSPHLGMKLIDESNKDSQDEIFDNLERVFEILGITADASKEFSTHNIGNFNEICEDVPNVQYYSIGAQKNGSTITKLI